jgi:hypothetical protein
MSFMSITDAAAELDILPQRLSRLLYEIGQAEANKLAPFCSRRRIVLRSSLPKLRQLVEEMVVQKRQPVCTR